MSKIRRKVTVENTKTISDSTSRRPSVFERLGPSTGSTAETQCRNWLKTGNCLYGNTCRFVHGPSPRGKGYSSSYRRSPERPTGDLRERMKNKRQDLEAEPQKRSTEESSSPVRVRMEFAELQNPSVAIGQCVLETWLWWLVIFKMF